MTLREKYQEVVGAMGALGAAISVSEGPVPDWWAAYRVACVLAVKVRGVRKTLADRARKEKRRMNA